MKKLAIVLGLIASSTAMATQPMPPSVGSRWEVNAVLDAFQQTSQYDTIIKKVEQTGRQQYVVEYYQYGSTTCNAVGFVTQWSSRPSNGAPVPRVEVYAVADRVLRRCK